MELGQEGSGIYIICAFSHLISCLELILLHRAETVAVYSVIMASQHSETEES